MTKSVELAQLGGIVSVSGNDVTLPGNFKSDVTGGTGVLRAVGNSTVTAYMFGSSGGGIGAVGTESNHPLAVYVNNGEVARFDTSGRLIIGATSGAYKLTVKDSANAFAGFYAASFSPLVVGQDSNGDTYVQNNANATLRLGANSTEYFRIDPANSQIVVKQAAGLGYGSGSGGTVTQLTSKATAVTLNKPAGKIVMNNAALAAATTVTFQLNNSLIASGDDLVLVNIADSIAAAGSYQAWISDVRAGYCQVNVRNMTAGSLSNAVSLSFAIIKGATS